MNISDIIQLIYTILTGGLLIYAFRTYKSSLNIFKINNQADLTIQADGLYSTTAQFTIKNVGHKCAKNIIISIEHDFVNEDISKNKETIEYLKSGKYFLCSNCKNTFILWNKNYKNSNGFTITIEYFNGYETIKEKYFFENKQIFAIENKI